MKSRGRILLRNPIVSRVRRHATVATLFRAAGPPPIQRAVEQALPDGAGLAAQPPVAVARPAAARTAVVQATLLPAATSLPTGYVIGAPPAPPVQRSPAIEAMRPSTLPVEGPAIQPSPTAPPEEESTFSEAVWRRLQTIFRGHQEKQAAPEAVPETEPPSVPARPGSPPQGALPVQRAAAQPGGPPEAEETPPPTLAESLTREPLVRELLPTETVSEPPPPHSPSVHRTVDDARARQPEATPDTPYPTDTLESPPPTATTAPQEFAFAEEETLVERRIIEPEIDKQAELPITAETPTIQPSEAPTPTSQPTSQPTKHLTTQPPAEEEIAALEPQWQPRPLQDVWPVQRLEAPPTPPEPPARPPSVPEALPTSSEEATATEEIQWALADVAPGGPTTSSIEVITPRQPRPTLRPEAGVPTEIEGPSPEVSAPPKTKEPHPEADISPDFEEPRPALMQEPAKPSGPQNLPGEIALPPPTVQMQRETDAAPDITQTRPLTETPAPALVQTEIGPLPADLWHLLGRSPPGQEPAEATPPQDTGQEATIADGNIADAAITDGRIARAVATAEAPPKPERPAIREIIPPVVQRVAAPGSAAEAGSLIQREPEEEQAETAATGSVTTESVATEAETAPETPAPRIDVDDLARRVYAEIKRRLSTEWERARRMF